MIRRDPRPRPQAHGGGAGRTRGAEGEPSAPSRERHGRRDGDEARDPEGRDADRPSEIPPRGLWQVLKRALREASNDNVSMLAASVAFYGMLAFVPCLVAMVTIYGLAFDPADLDRQLQSAAGTLPAGVQEILADQLHNIVSSDEGGLTIALIVSIAVAMWSTSSGVQGLLRTVNVAYDEEESRSGVKLRLISLGVTVFALAGFLIAFALIGIMPTVLDSLGIGEIGKTLLSIARWPLLALMALVALAAIYRWGPDREPAKWRWVTWGSALAVGLWLLASILFAVYVENFGSYQETYGALAAVVVMLLWLWISAWAVLLGAEVNAELEHQTARDSTTGPPRPQGRRGAYVADDVAE